VGMMVEFLFYFILFFLTTKFLFFMEKIEAIEWLKNNPEATVKEFYQLTGLSKRTFYNYKHELSPQSKVVSVCYNPPVSEVLSSISNANTAMDVLAAIGENKLLRHQLYILFRRYDIL
jgi:ACT domain-containing protein